MVDFEAKAREVWNEVADTHRSHGLAAIISALREVEKETDTALRARIAQLETALKPFAEIEPSSLFAADGSEDEAYIVYLAGAEEGHTYFTGMDLASARRALEGRTEAAGPRAISQSET